MSQLDLARIQFGMTSIYHFLFVPVTIGLAFLTAILRTVWCRNHVEDTCDKASSHDAGPGLRSDIITRLTYPSLTFGRISNSSTDRYHAPAPEPSLAELRIGGVNVE